MKGFLKNLGSFALAVGLGGVLLFIVNVTAGRLLGPEEYGKYALILSISQFMIIPMLLGLNTAMVKYGAAEKDAQQVFSSGFYVVLALTFVSTVLLYVTRGFWIHIVDIPEGLYLTTLAYAVVLALKYLAEAILRGLHDFPRQSRLEIVSTIALTVIFFSFVLFSPRRTFHIYAAAIIGSFFLYGILGFWIKRKYLSWHFVRLHWVKKLLHYGMYAIIGGLAGFVLGNIDRIMISRLLDTASVGIYSAYFSASMAIVGPGLSIFLNVFFPAISKAVGKRAILRKLNTVFAIITVPIIVTTFFLIWGVLLLYGDAYPVDFFMIGLFSINIGIFFVGNVKWWFIASVSVRGVRFTATHSLVAATLNFALNIVLIGSFGIRGAIMATICASVYFILLSSYYFHRVYAEAN